MCALDIDNKIIIADMRLVGLHSEVLVMSLHSMHIYVISKEEHAQEVLLSNVFGQRCHKFLFILLFSSTNKYGKLIVTLKTHQYCPLYNPKTTIVLRRRI
jgi:hypothetical protein